MKKWLLGAAALGLLVLIGKKLRRQHPADEHFQREAEAQQHQAG